jgi:uncharacterized phage protein (TIGR02218 family)
MKTISAGLATHLAGEVTTLATCWKCTLRSGTVVAFTDHDRDLVVDAVTYQTAAGYTRSAISTTAGLDVDNLELEGVLAAPSITEADLAAGVWDYAQIQIFLVNWADLTQGTLKLRRGFLGEVSAGRAQFTAELRGLAQVLQQTIGEVYSPACKADLFDARCKLVDTEATWKFSGIAVSTIVAAQRQWTSVGLAQAADFFTAGRVEWQTGLNAGLFMEIKTHASGGNITLQEPMPYTVSVGDTYRIWAGCRKRYTEDCGTKFSNQVNYRGFPHLPGNDAILRGPS